MDADIRKAEKEIEYVSSNPEDLALYRAREASLHERANLISTGRAEGRKEGREEALLEIATKLLLEESTDQRIKEMTGLDDKHIDQLRASLGK